VRVNVAFVVPRYGPEIVGGAETLVRGLAEHLAADGAAVDVLTTCARDHLSWQNVLRPGVAVEHGVTVRRFPVRARDGRRYGWLHQRIQRGGPVPVEDELRWAEESVWSEELFSHLLRRRTGYDVVCFAPYLYGTTLWGVPLVPERAVLIPCLHDEPFAQLSVVRAAFDAARGFIFNAPPEAALAEKLYGLGDRPSGVVGLGFDPPPPTDAALFRRRHRLEGPMVLYLGRKETGKNVPLLIQYLLRYRETHRADVTLVLAGDGPVTAPRGARGIRDLGYLAPLEKAAAYAAATVVCQPSVNESFSIVLMEAWLAGTPVLVHAACPVTTYHTARAEGGLAFGDYYEFAEALGLLLEDDGRRRRLGLQGRAYVQTEYAWPAVTARLRHLLGRVTAPAAGPDGRAAAGPAVPASAASSTHG
jgi:glycosyltransferase involved in cell wall biosynthesis